MAPNAPGTMRRVALVGATGYTGAECLRLLRGHPGFELTHLCAESRAGLPLAEALPPFWGVDLPMPVRFDPDETAARADVAILALPHGTAQDAAAALLERGVAVVDLSADHRFADRDAYARIYGEHKHPHLLQKTVYGLPELNRAAIRESRLIGCPGCYPTAVVLAALPALRTGVLSHDEVIADCKSGVSGAGRTAVAGTHFPETSEGIHAYKTLTHRHGPEMSMALGGARVRFVPHLVPMNRGILATVYLRLKPGMSAESVRAHYGEAYDAEPFVTVLPDGVHPDTRNVRGTNRCHIGLFIADDLLVVQSVIDNLVKGAAGQAIQCLNLMAGHPETLGLEHTALFLTAMCGPIVLLLLTVPVLEIWGLVEVGRRLGVLETLALLVTNAVIGLSIAKSQGLSAVRRVQTGVAPPGAEVLSAPLLLLAAALLVIPGFLTDVAGFLLLVPPLRRALARRWAGRLASSVRWQGTVRAGGVRRTEPPPHGVIDVEVVKRDQRDD